MGALGWSEGGSVRHTTHVNHASWSLYKLCGLLPCTLTPPCCRVCRWFTLNAAAAGGTVAAFEGTLSMRGAWRQRRHSLRGVSACAWESGKTAAAHSPFLHVPCRHSHGQQHSPRARVAVQQCLADGAHRLLRHWAWHKVRGRERALLASLQRAEWVSSVGVLGVLGVRHLIVFSDTRTHLQTLRRRSHCFMLSGKINTGDGHTLCDEVSLLAGLGRSNTILGLSFL